MPSSGDEDRPSGGKKEKSRRPGNTAFRQQRLKAWQPILTPKTVLPLFFALGIVFGPLGGLLLWASAQVQEIVIDYTKCTSASSEFEVIPSSHYSVSFNKPLPEAGIPKWSMQNGTTCKIQFTLPSDFNPPVLFYYRLANFYQNHRRYVQSLDEQQLKGDARTRNDLVSSDDCSPLIVNKDKKPYYPCGLIANSMFNDTFKSPALLNSQSSEPRPYNMTNTGIAWSSDRKRYGKTKYTVDDVVPPPNWVKKYGEKYEVLPDLTNWEEFHVWMRTAGLPTFSKLALRNDKDVMGAGRYQVDIEYNFPVSEYAGTKSIVISTRTVMGGKNPFLGIAYVVVAGICVVLGAVFTARHLYKPRKLGDHTYLSWNNDEAPAH
ncbi:uncharacterized protein LAJ45_03201 [Morchella importuna]|uniref:uncharacterized protein n=1 Tax=Morchella importuna TaxID=1174673 RepID=UPI001E8D229F|nr:uncharacterized protein LAJ45_03201 [Morchella importuna]KAH8152974.1 hypothetical protein LAJ45_03201 [Morchella importuna]